jgi:transposase
VGAGHDGARSPTESAERRDSLVSGRDILGFSARTVRRWRERYEKHGYVGLVDKRRQSPSVRRIAAPEVQRLLRFYRERYRGFNVRHFHQLARREHGVSVSYSFLKQTLRRPDS